MAMLQVQMALKQGTDQKTIVDGRQLSMLKPKLQRVHVLGPPPGILYCADGIEPDLQEWSMKLPR